LSFTLSTLSLVALGLLVSCGGGSGGSTATTAPTTTTTTTTATTTTTTTTTAATPTPPVVEACPAASKGSASGVGVIPAVAIAQLPIAQRQAALSAALGTPKRLLTGLGSVDIASVQKQSIKVDIYDQYLAGNGATGWPTYASPSGAYVQVVANNADCLGAVPMFTVYQMAASGEGNMDVLHDFAFMRQYWDQLRLMFTQIKSYGKPVLVNLEPDLWGYTQRISRDPTVQFVHVGVASVDCTNLSDDVIGLAGCMIQMARKYAPNAYIGFPPSQFQDVAATENAYMKRLGTDKADFSVMQTLDRDIGCIEAKYAAANCDRATVAKIWDTTNATSPNFTEHFAYARTYFEAIGLPLIWWQTPLGVPSATAGGTALAFRDNRAAYFLSKPSELVAAGGVGVVYSPGHVSQTNINTDGGQFKTLSTAYLSKPAALP
jgi:hypothetical protein